MWYILNRCFIISVRAFHWNINSLRCIPANCDFIFFYFDRLWMSGLLRVATDFFLYIFVSSTILIATSIPFCNALQIRLFLNHTLHPIACIHCLESSCRRVPIVTDLLWSPITDSHLSMPWCKRIMYRGSLSDMWQSGARTVHWKKVLIHC